MESVTLTFSFYWRCDLEKLNLELSTQLKTPSGISSSIVKLIFGYLVYVKSQSFTQSLINAMDEANYSGTDEDWKNVGRPFGEFFAYMAGYEIPNYDFMYGDNARNYW